MCQSLSEHVAKIQHFGPLICPLLFTCVRFESAIPEINHLSPLSSPLMP